MNWFIGVCVMIFVNGEPACRNIREIQCANEAQCIRALEAMHLPEGQLAYYYAITPAPKAATPPAEAAPKPEAGE